MARLLRSRSAFAALVAAVAIVLAVGWLSVGRAAPAPDLPSVSPTTLIASALHAVANQTPLSGTVKTHVDLGIPQLPSTLSDPAGPAGVLLADQTFKVWYSPDGVRVAQILPFGERDLVANRTDVWFWDAQRFTAWHYAVDRTVPSQTPPSLGDLTGLVSKVLREDRSYVEATVVQPQVVAGRDAYVLRLTPATDDTLLGRIEVAIDAETRMPLRIQVFPRGSSTAVLEAGYTSIGFGPVDASMFTFTPPSDVTVKQVTDEGPGSGPPGSSGAQPFQGVRVFGGGFGLILAVRVTDVPADVRPLFPYAGPLGSADVVDRGDHSWVVAGLVRPAALAEVEPKLT
jgi:outer membrane lipoprotein-sorting protein